MTSAWPTAADNLAAITSVPAEITLSEAGLGSFNHWQHHKAIAEAVDKLQLLTATLDHDHSGTGTRPSAKLLQANTHQSPDTDSSTTALHHTLGWGTFQAARGSDVAAALLVVDATKINGRTLYVQTATPSASVDGNVWFEA